MQIKRKIKSIYKMGTLGNNEYDNSIYYCVGLGKNPLQKISEHNPPVNGIFEKLDVLGNSICEVHFANEVRYVRNPDEIICVKD